MNVEKTLAELRVRITKARDDLRIVEEQLLFQSDVLEDAKTRMLVSETPLADREFRIARDDYERLAMERGKVRDRITEMEIEQDRLLDRMLGSNA